MISRIDFSFCSVVLLILLVRLFVETSVRRLFKLCKSYDFYEKSEVICIIDWVTHTRSISSNPGNIIGLN